MYKEHSQILWLCHWRVSIYYIAPLLFIIAWTTNMGRNTGKQQNGRTPEAAGQDWKSYEN